MTNLKVTSLTTVILPVLHRRSGQPSGEAGGGAASSQPQENYSLTGHQHARVTHYLVPQHSS